MKSPQDMRIIQIDVTNACIHHCSNCTRFCGHHKKNFFMDFETFKRAVDSLDGYVGTIGIMGGEPTLNPEFEKMVEYLATKKPQMQTDVMLRPQQHFMDSIYDLEMAHTFAHPCLGDVRQTVNGPGLWSAISENYKKYYETIQDNIQYQALNDHTNAMYHQPALISRKALGIPDEEWLKLRDNCWIQNVWSATITPKGAFFCEIAGALDMLFDGPGGWPIESGWWKKTPEEFGDQLHWCELCGLACNTFMRDANEEVYDVSEDIYEKLVEIGSREIGTDHLNIVKIENGEIAEESKASISKRFGASMPYTESYSARFNEEKTSLLYKELFGFFVCDDKNLEDCIHNITKVSKSAVFATQEIINKLKNDLDQNVDVTYYSKDDHNLGYALYECLKDGNHNRYLVYIDGHAKIMNLEERMSHLVLNPGTLLYSEVNEAKEDDYFAIGDYSRVAMFNGIAHSIKNAGWDKVLTINDISEIKEIWQDKKVFEFNPETERKAPTAEIIAGKKYVVYGAGRNLQIALDIMASRGANVVAVVDTAAEKHGKTICGYEIQNPDYLVSHRSEFDYVLISSSIYYREMKKVIMEKGLTELDIAWV